MQAVIDDLKTACVSSCSNVLAASRHVSDALWDAVKSLYSIKSLFHSGNPSSEALGTTIRHG